MPQYPFVVSIFCIAGNIAYIDAFKLIEQLNNFQGTPYTIWGSDQVSGADAIDFGNSPPTSSTDIQIVNMTHAQILQQLASFNDQFSQSEYAAADLYVAMICSSINNTALVCFLPVYFVKSVIRYLY